MGFVPASGLLIGLFLVLIRVLMIYLMNLFFNLVRDLFFTKTEMLSYFDLLLC